MASDSTPSGAQIEPGDGLSYVRGATDILMSDATVSRHLLAIVERFADRSAVVFREPNVRWTWREFADEVDVFATALLDLGVAAGDRVGIWSPNRAEWLLTQFAAARIGAVLVNINPAYRLAGLEYALNKVGCKTIVAAEQFKSSKYLDMLQTLAPELRAVIRMGEAKTSGMLNFDELMRASRARVDTGRLDAPEAALQPDDPINIQFTTRAGRPAIRRARR